MLNIVVSSNTSNHMKWWSGQTLKLSWTFANSFLGKRSEWAPALKYIKLVPELLLWLVYGWNFNMIYACCLCFCFFFIIYDLSLNSEKNTLTSDINKVWISSQNVLGQEFWFILRFCALLVEFCHFSKLMIFFQHCYILLLSNSAWNKPVLLTQFQCQDLVWSRNPF